RQKKDVLKPFHADNVGLLDLAGQSPRRLPPEGWKDSILSVCVRTTFPEPTDLPLRWTERGICRCSQP
ncbi:hypothetical protein J6590_098040, partial [Homalodisca vitripennis]